MVEQKKHTPDLSDQDSEWPLWEVFVQEKQGAPHEHAGSLHAPDAEMALQNARDVYARRERLLSIWVVPAAAITASTPADDGPFLIPVMTRYTAIPSFTRYRGG